MIVSNPGNFIGTALFLNQVYTASEMGFNYLRTYITGSHGSFFSGYAKCARVGYVQD